MIQAKLISSLDKCFPGTDIAGLSAIEEISVLRGERLSLQLAYRGKDPTKPRREWYTPRVSGRLAEYARLRLVDFVPSLMPAYPDRVDDNYLSTEPGLYPDLLSELPMRGMVPVLSFQTRCLWITIEIPDDLPGGTYELEVGLYSGDTAAATATARVMVIPARLPEGKMYVTQWLHCDCLADYYSVGIFSERHWGIIENFVRTAVANGINTLLTPVFTPPLDTAVGGERPTVQLVGVRVDGGEYSFDYTKLDRWLDMCGRTGIKYFEISHLFTQWGAAHAPKIVATVDGVEKRIFGWDTEAAGPEYTRFLRTFIPDFLEHMKSRGLDKRCIFHISDEPRLEHLEQYAKSRAVVADLLDGYTVADALSSFEFWGRGIVSTPIPSNNHIEPFLKAKVPGLWTYYCCSQGVDVSNRFFAMPGARTRAIGMQFYKYDIAGFLQWGYNFYFNQFSCDRVNPYLDSTGGYFVPSGDAYSVYPSHDGRALESMRIVHFFEALQDRRAMDLCGQYYGKERVVAEMERIIGEIKFSKCPGRSEELLAVRERINQLISEAVGG
jgi:hypothetical protein